MNQNGYCPSCGEDFDGELIIETFMRMNGLSREDATKWAQSYQGWEEYGEGNRWDEKLSISVQYGNSSDGYKCKKCGEEFKSPRRYHEAK